MFSITPLLFDALEPPRISVQTTLYCQKLESLGYIFVADSIDEPSFELSQWAPKDERVWNGVHYDHSRSYKVVDFGTNRKRVYDFLFDLNSNLGPIAAFQRLQLLYAESHLSRTPPLFRRKFVGVPFGVDPWRLGCKEWTPQANWPWNYFWRIPTYVITDHNSPTLQTDGQTDRQTDRQHAIARPRFALKCIAR